MTRQVQTIALVEWCWTGHHPTYFVHFASALAEIGCRVVPLCPSPEDFERKIASTPIVQSTSSRAKISPSQPLVYTPTSNIRPYRLRPIIQAIRHFGGIGKKLRAWERRNGCKIDLVFFACIYDSNFEWLKYAERFFGYPWSGLYLHARSFRMPGTLVPYCNRMPCPEKIFTLRSMHSVGLLDEGAVEPMRKLNGNKPTIEFPDFCDAQLPANGEPSNRLAEKVRSFADGRPIVSLIGHLQRTKGLEEFTKAACHGSLTDVVFFLGGAINWMEIAESDRREMITAWEQSPNIFTHLFPMSEPALNAVIAASDVVFAAYTDFPNSSNILTKAASLNRPVIVSDGYLMAERTRTFGLGEVVAERNVDAIVDAIRRMTAKDYSTTRHKDGRRDAYLQRHSYNRLVHSFEELCSIAPS